MCNKHKLNIQNYAEWLYNMKKRLSLLPGGEKSKKTGKDEINNTILNIPPNIWDKQAYLQGFNFNADTYQMATNILN